MKHNHQKFSYLRWLLPVLVFLSGESILHVVAQHMMADYVQSIQLAPNGIVTEIYPEVGNEAGKIDLIPDETRGDIVNYGIDNNIVVMQGPFELKQGGFSMY